MRWKSFLKSVFLLGILVIAIIGGITYFTEYKIPLQDDVERDFYLDAAKENISSEDMNFTRFEDGEESNYVYFDNRSARIEVRVGDEGNIISKEVRYSPSDISNEYILSREEAISEARSYLPGSSWELVESRRQAGNYVLQMTREKTYSRLWVDGSEGKIVYYYRDFMSGNPEEQEGSYDDEEEVEEAD